MRICQTPQAISRTSTSPVIPIVKSFVTLAGAGRQCGTADPECPHDLGDEPKMAGPAFDAEDLSANDHAPDRRDHTGIVLDSGRLGVVSRAELPVESRDGTGHQVTGHPV